MKPTYSIEEVLKLIESADPKELAIISELLRDEFSRYSGEEIDMLMKCVLKKIGEIFNKMQ